MLESIAGGAAFAFGGLGSGGLEGIAAVGSDLLFGRHGVLRLARVRGVGARGWREVVERMGQRIVDGRLLKFRGRRRNAGCGIVKRRRSDGTVGLGFVPGNRRMISLRGCGPTGTCRVAGEMGTWSQHRSQTDHLRIGQRPQLPERDLGLPWVHFYGTAVIRQRAGHYKRWPASAL